ncbi:DUF4837 family protein [Aureispira anguillae]|uniref:DUF4837 family protein n=1 Tax=Aureispira anguillae TaxID=2864201 RepID=A0A916DVH6_9BACT|nr:DUF4837 family protein [Aureispira anguillae]BDS13737.1 DUF4837 family protein [Aureispira anguillae]
MQHFLSYLITTIIIISVLFSCTEKQRTRFAVTPTAYGKVDNIMVVADEYTWTTTIGDTFRNYFEALYPVTPQPEPIYDLRYKTPTQFKEGKILKTHRAILIIGALDDMNDPASAEIRKAIGKENVQRAKEQSTYRIAIHKDRWAQGQTVIYWFGPTRNELLKTIVKDYQKVMNQFNKADTKLFIQQIYAPGQNIAASREIQKNFNLNLKIPKEYVVANLDSASIWLRRETNKTSSSIFIYSLPLADSTLPSPKHHKHFRNKLTKVYFSTRIKGSYMTMDDISLPIYYQEMNFDNKPTLQARGLWKMEVDQMGGSFVTYMIKDVPNNRVILLDGFVHAPGQKKRPEMRKLDMIFSTLSS